MLIERWYLPAVDSVCNAGYIICHSLQQINMITNNIKSDLYIFSGCIVKRNHQVLREAAQHVTRFISLAHVGNPDKKKVNNSHILLITGWFV